MDEEYKDKMKQSCLHRWDAIFDKLELSRRAASAEIMSRFVGELYKLTPEEDEKLFQELVEHCLSNR